MTIFPKSFFGLPQKVFGDEPPPFPHPAVCENCAGRGFLTAFVVAHGPYLHTPPLGKGEVLKSVDDPQYGYVWYTGKSIADDCLPCAGTGKAPKMAEQKVYSDV